MEIFRCGFWGHPKSYIPVCVGYLNVCAVECENWLPPLFNIHVSSTSFHTIPGCIIFCPRKCGSGGGGGVGRGEIGFCWQKNGVKEWALKGARRRKRVFSFFSFATRPIRERKRERKEASSLPLSLFLIQALPKWYSKSLCWKSDISSLKRDSWRCPFALHHASLVNMSCFKLFHLHVQVRTFSNVILDTLSTPPPPTCSTVHTDSGTPTPPSLSPLRHLMCGKILLFFCNHYHLSHTALRSSTVQ